ncbi:hypothetical protein [Shewanella marina]|nr:hypothetical protein [Shewanella marina]
MIQQLHQGKMGNNHIGLMNVQQRLTMLYGEGLHITRLEKGTEMMFYVS